MLRRNAVGQAFDPAIVVGNPRFTGGRSAATSTSYRLDNSPKRPGKIVPTILTESNRSAGRARCRSLLFVHGFQKSEVP